MCPCIQYICMHVGVFKGFAVAGCQLDQMGIGPVFAVPKLLHRHGLKISDIDLWYILYHMCNCNLIQILVNIVII